MPRFKVDVTVRAKQGVITASKIVEAESFGELFDDDTVLEPLAAELNPDGKIEGDDVNGLTVRVDRVAGS